MAGSFYCGQADARAWEQRAKFGCFLWIPSNQLTIIQTKAIDTPEQLQAYTTNLLDKLQHDDFVGETVLNDKAKLKECSKAMKQHNPFSGDRSTPFWYWLHRLAVTAGKPSAGLSTARVHARCRQIALCLSQVLNVVDH